MLQGLQEATFLKHISRHHTAAVQEVSPTAPRSGPKRPGNHTNTCGDTSMASKPSLGDRDKRVT